MKKLYVKTSVTEMIPWDPRVDMARVSVSQEDKENGSPKMGDMIANVPDNPGDQWLVNEAYFKANYEEC